MLIGDFMASERKKILRDIAEKIGAGENLEDLKRYFVENARATTDKTRKTVIKTNFLSTFSLESQNFFLLFVFFSAEESSDITHAPNTHNNIRKQHNYSF